MAHTFDQFNTLHNYSRTWHGMNSCLWWSLYVSASAIIL